MLIENRDKLDFIAEFLLKHEVMDGDQFHAAMEGASMEELEQMAETKKQQSRDENEAKAREQREQEAFAEGNETTPAGVSPFPCPTSEEEMVDSEVVEPTESEEDKQDGE